MQDVVESADAEPEEIILNVDSWTRDELAEFVVWQAYGSSDVTAAAALARRRARVRAILGVLGASVCLATIAAGVHRGWPAIVLVLLLVCFPVLFVTAANFWFGLRGISATKHWIAGRAVNMPPRNYSMRLNRLGVQMVDPEDSLLPWSSYAKVEVTSLLVASRFYDGKCAAVPRRCIGTGSEFERVNGIILKWFREGGGGRPEPTIERLSRTNIPCKRCGYSLLGVNRLVCPECGRELDLVEL